MMLEDLIARHHPDKLDCRCHMHFSPTISLQSVAFSCPYIWPLIPASTQTLTSFQRTMASATAQRRLLQEYRALTNNPPDGITAGPVSEDDLLNWEALIQGPEGTPFEGGIFPAELKFPKDYPLAPPSMRFLGEVWHPNGKWLFDSHPRQKEKGKPYVHDCEIILMLVFCSMIS